MASANVNDCDPIKSEETTQVMDHGSVETETWTRTTVPTFYRGNDISADEMALSIVHIREQLFSLMTPWDLFKCRRLNRNWNSYATAELQERFELKCAIKKKALEEYLNLLQKHQEILSFLPLPIFRKYSFEKVTCNILSDPMLQQFLRTYGYFIYDLRLMQEWPTCFRRIGVPKEKDVMDCVRSLLVQSAPNLSSLRMDDIQFPVDWKENSLDRISALKRTLRTTDPEFDEIHSIPNTEKNENLKFFSFSSISGKIFELAIQLAPNLEEIQVRRDGYEIQDHKYFIEPLNRLRFYKDMKYSTDSTGLFNRIADLAQEGNLKLRHISFMFGKEEQTDPDDEYFLFNLHPRFLDVYNADDVDAVSKILASSWDSLETIAWRWVMEVPGLKWPDVMPNVSRIDLGPYDHTLSEVMLAFPPDFNWSKTFPKLRELHFCEGIERRGFWIMLQYFKSQCIDNVEEVHVFEQNSEERTFFVPFEELRRLFPSAKVFSSWPFTNFNPFSNDSFTDSDSTSTDSDGDFLP